MSMYYVTDPHHPQLKQRLHEAVVLQRSKHPALGDLHVYALVDGALDEALGHTLLAKSQASREEVQALYDGTALQEAEECGLFLLAVQEKQAGALLRKARTKPMLSFLQSALPLQEMRAHLAQFNRAHTSDGLWLTLRWGSPNRVTDLMDALDQEARAVLLSGFVAWHLIDRSGDLQTIEGHMAGPAQPSAAPAADRLPHSLTFSDQAIAQLVDASEADRILFEAFNQTPADKEQRSATLLHSMACAVLKEMDHLDIQGPNTRNRLVQQCLHCDSFDAALALLKAHTA